MKLLILGGTIFLGRHLVDAAQARGHEVTLFNRGQHNTDLYPTLEKLRGDRDGNLGVLRGRQWDAVVDTCGYVPRLVRDSASLLANVVEHYTFISSISVYPDLQTHGLDENSPVGTLQDETVEEVNGETYGPLKALCEQAAEAAMPGRVLNVRAGLIVGPHDQSDRFSYWPHRVAQGGSILAPGNPEARIEFIDGRDLAEWVIEKAEVRVTGIYNVTGPEQMITMQELLEACRRVAKSDGQLVWVNEEFLHENEVGAWIELPLWVPSESTGIHQVNVQKAIRDGLKFRPLSETVADTLSWLQTRPDDWEWRAGLKPERERELLAKWEQQNRT